jgi:hypothetical protein
MPHVAILNELHLKFWLAGCRISSYPASIWRPLEDICSSSPKLGMSVSGVNKLPDSSSFRWTATWRVWEHSQEISLRA